MSSTVCDGKRRTSLPRNSFPTKMASKQVREVEAKTTNRREDAAQALFQDILSKARTVALPPACCVTYVKIRNIWESGVRQLMHSSQDKCSDGSLSVEASTVATKPSMNLILR